MRQEALLAATFVLLSSPARADQPAVPSYAQPDARLGRQCAAGRETACAKLVHKAVGEKDPEVARGVVWWLRADLPLLVVARTALTPGVRIAAASKLTDGAARTEIARNDADPGVRRALVESGKLVDPTVTALLARTDPDPGVRGTAAHVLNDQATLAEIARTDPNDWVRAAAVQRLTDPALLAELGRKDQAPSVRVAAVHGITDPTALAEIATLDAAEEPAAAAASRLADPVLASEVARHASRARVRANAVANVSDEAALIEILARDPADEVRRRALSQLERILPRGAARFAEIAEHTTNAWIRKVAVADVSDATVLARIARGDADPEVRSAALGRVKDPMVIADVVQRDDSAAVRAAALVMLATLGTLPEPLISDRALKQAIERQRRESNRHNRRYGTIPVLEGGFGSDTRAFGAIGVRVYEEGPSRFGPSWVARLEPGADAGRLSVGRDFGTRGVGLAVNAALIKPWTSGELRIGTELDLGVINLPLDVVHFRVGIATPLGALGRETKLTWGVSANIVDVLIGAMLLIFPFPCIGCH